MTEQLSGERPEREPARAWRALECFHRLEVREGRRRNAVHLEQQVALAHALGGGGWEVSFALAHEMEVVGSQWGTRRSLCESTECKS